MINTISGGIATDCLLNVEGAAQRLCVSKSYLNKLRVEGTGPVYCKLGRAVRYRSSDLDGWIASRKTTNTSQTTGGANGQ